MLMLVSREEERKEENIWKMIKLVTHRLSQTMKKIDASALELSPGDVVNPQKISSMIIGNIVLI